MAIQIIEKIKEIKQLLDEGILTQEEFNVEKAKLMEKYVKPIQGDTLIQSKLVQSEESREVRELRELKEQGILTQEEYLSELDRVKSSKDEITNVNVNKSVSSQIETPTKTKILTSKSDEDSSSTKGLLIFGAIILLIFGIIVYVKNNAGFSGFTNTDTVGAEEDSGVERDAFVTPDLAFFDLRGHVETLTETPSLTPFESTTYGFSKEGELMSVVNLPSIFLDKINGRFTRTSNGHYEFLYDSDGTRLEGYKYGHMGEGVNVYYKYNLKGQRVGEQIDHLDEEYENVISTENITYTDIEYDSHGNWTSRIRNGEEQYRNITYYE
jgi:hypothetical protein